MIKLKSFFMSFSIHFLTFLLLIFLFRFREESSAKYIEIDLSLSSISTDLIEAKKIDFKNGVYKSFPKKEFKNLAFQKEKGYEITQEKIFRFKEENLIGTSFKEKIAIDKVNDEESENLGDLGGKDFDRHQGMMEGDKNIGMIKSDREINSRKEFSEKSIDKFLADKLSIISQIVQKNINYPYIARKMGWEGKVIISFILTKEGKIEDLWIEKTSGYEVLDKNALETIQKVSKYFPIPPLDVKIKLPVLYRLE